MNVNKLLVFISVAAAAIIFLTFAGQSSAFYTWHSLSTESHKYFITEDQTAARELEALISHSAPRMWDWMMIRVLSGGIVVGALGALWVDLRKVNAKLHQRQPARPI
jgi:hypothetical protein